MSDFSGLHAEVKAKLLDRGGVDVEFTKTGTGTYDPTTDKFSGSGDVSVLGQALEIPGDPEEYASRGLDVKTAVTLMFVPATFGELPAISSTIFWDGRLLTVKSLKPLRPGGTAIASFVYVE